MSENRTVTMSEAQRRSGASIVLAVVSVGLCVLVEGAILVSRHVLSRAIDDFQVSVSVITRAALSPLFPMLLAIVVVAGICKEFVPGSRSASDKCNLVILLIGLSCLAIYVVGIFVPLMSLIGSLS